MSDGVKVVCDIERDIRFNDQGLVPVIVQEHSSKDVLMMAWMDLEALKRTVNEGRVTYYSRSRGEYWRKGDTSGNIQHALSVHIDCDGDTVLLVVEQTGPACHTGSRTCF
jgi:phosphoribosyl-AMP cyclohydrolase